MGVRHSRILSIILIAGTPFLIAGIFVYRNAFPDVETIIGAPIHLARDVFLASSIIPAIGSVLVALLIQTPLLLMLRSDPVTHVSKLVLILTGIALLPILWVAIVVTETWVRSIYFGLWDMYVLGFPPVSTTSLVVGILVSIFVLLLSIQPAIKKGAA